MMAPSSEVATNGRACSPIVKWVGGKRQLLNEIMPLLPKGRIFRYVELFVGGGAVFFDLARQGRIEEALLVDVNRDLVETYEAVRDDVGGVLDALERHRNEEDYYYALRKNVPELPAERAARILYLNKTGFNGLYRVNARGGYNVPFGRYANPKIRDEGGLRAASKALSIAELHAGDFADVLGRIERGDVVYCDPPYVPLSATSSFTGYAKGGFTLEDQTRLRDVAMLMKARGVHVILSNSSAHVVRELYSEAHGFRCIEVAASRRVNCQGTGRGNVTELLIT